MGQGFIARRQWSNGVVKVYLAGEFGGDAILQRMRRRLFSYWYHHDGDRPSYEVIECNEKYKMDMFLDSGAFTAFTQKVVITPEEYAKYVHNVKHRFTVCSSLDAIGDAAKSYELLKELEALGCRVQPVYHAREDPMWLKKYLDEGYDYIFIGGMVPETTNWLRGWLDDLFDKYLTWNTGMPRVKLHGFGLTDQQLMFRYPWHSVDSTSWLFTGMFGGCVFMTNAGLRKITFSRQSPSAKKLEAPHYDNLKPIEQAQVDKWLATHELTAAQCIESYNFRHMVNARTFGEMELLGAKTFKLRQQGIF
jgi:hypothetical protein